MLGGKLTGARWGEVGLDEAGVASREAVRLGDALLCPPASAPFLVIGSEEDVRTVGSGVGLT